MSDLAIINEKNNETKKYIIFQVNKEVYGIDVATINNIIQMPKITRVPMSPDYYQGIISLRGDIIPIMSLRGRMNFGEDTITKDSRIIILNLANDERMGIIVDDVKEVMNISENEIEEPSPLLKNDINFIKGVGKKDDQLISIFEVNSLIA